MQDRKGAQQGPSTNRKQLSVWLPLINIIKVGSYIIQTKKNHSSISLMRGVSCAVNANAPGNDIVIQMIYACINGQRAYQNELRRRASSVSYSPWRCMSVSAKKNMLWNCIYDTFGALACHRMLVARSSVECDDAMTRVDGGWRLNVVWEGD